MTKSPWKWGEDANQRLELLLAMAEKANSQAEEHLKSLTIHLVEAKLKAEKHRFGGRLQGIPETIVEYVGSTQPEGSFWRDEAEKTVNKQNERMSIIPAIEVQAQEIIASIPSKKICELYQRIEDIVNKKPIFGIAMVINVIEIQSGPKPLPKYFAKVVDQGA